MTAIHTEKAFEQAIEATSWPTATRRATRPVFVAI